MPNKLLVVDRVIFNLYEELFKKYLDNPESLVLLDAFEDNKTVETALAVCQKATEIGSKRNLKIIAIGGGIIQDIAGFAAHILYRGVGLILVPTTLLAQGDSCIGSKNSINYLKYKNLLGTFYPPEKVYICFQFLDTLSDIDFHSGLSEIVRFNIMENFGSIDYVKKSLNGLFNRDYRVVYDFMERAHIYKKKMVELDEFDLHERKIFNYGHTFGHAFEVISNYEIPHGLGVALGMITADKIALERGILSATIVKSIEEICLQLYNGKPLQCNDFTMLIDVLKKDKKREADNIAAVLPLSNGSFEVVQDIKSHEVIPAVQYTQELINKGESR
jgi:3-dehydroquinate synthase